MSDLRLGSFLAMFALAIASCRTHDVAAPSSTTSGDTITFVVNGTVRPGEVDGDHALVFTAHDEGIRSLTVHVFVMDQTTAEAVCGLTSAAFEDRGVRVEPGIAVVDAYRHASATTASFTLAPHWHVASVGVAKRDQRDSAPDMGDVQILRNGVSMTNDRSLHAERAFDASASR